MQIRNNYDIYWEGTDGKSYGSGVYNGDLGIIRKITSEEIEIIFDDDKIVKYESNIIEEIEHAYAITIHKSQGSEFPVVIIPILAGNPKLYNKNLLYTAVTRAKKMVVLIGKSGNIYYMINNKYSVERKTLLKEFLQNSNLSF